MKEVSEYEKDLASIRNLMEKSAKFLSLSGMSGVLAGIYALAGATAAYFIVEYPRPPYAYRTTSATSDEVLWKLILIAIAVLVASLATGLYFSNRKANKDGQKLWTPASRNLVVNLSIPLITGGLFIIIILTTGHYGLAAPASLIFYGLALIQASPNTYDEVRYLGLSEIVLGLISALLPGFGLIFWAIGFGLLHVFYGALMHNKYDK